MDAASAIVQIADEIRRDPGPVEPWHRLVQLLMVTGQAARAIAVLEQRHAVGADSLSVLYDALGVMVLRQPAAMRDFVAAVPRDHAFQPIAAIAALRQAAVMVPAIKSFAETDPAFVERIYPLLINQVEQLATADESGAGVRRPKNPARARTCRGRAQRGDPARIRN